MGFVLAFIVGHRAESGASWWFIEPRSWLAKASFTCTWAVLLPLFFGWIALGFSWLTDTMHNTPDCFPEDGYLTPTVCALSQTLCGIGAALYVVFVANVWDAEKCRRANTVAIQSVEDNDLVNRWGQLKPSVTMELCGGLSPKELADLPRHVIHRHRSASADVCAICLNVLMVQDHARALPGCGHLFHRACIDLWLLRQTTCPLCKKDARCVKPSAQHSGCSSCLCEMPSGGQSATS